ncbi:MAG TPA: hypothetical protein VGJ20_33065 [Xanthobacteraceae bacterium]
MDDGDGAGERRAVLAAVAPQPQRGRGALEVAECRARADGVGIHGASLPLHRGTVRQAGVQGAALADLLALFLASHAPPLREDLGEQQAHQAERENAI